MWSDKPNSNHTNLNPNPNCNPKMPLTVAGPCVDQAGSHPEILCSCQCYAFFGVLMSKCSNKSHFAGNLQFWLILRVLFCDYMPLWRIHFVLNKQVTCLWFWGSYAHIWSLWWTFFTFKHRAEHLYVTVSYGALNSAHSFIMYNVA